MRNKAYFVARTAFQFQQVKVQSILRTRPWIRPQIKVDCSQQASKHGKVSANVILCRLIWMQNAQHKRVAELMPARVDSFSYPPSYTFLYQSTNTNGNKQCQDANSFPITFSRQRSRRRRLWMPITVGFDDDKMIARFYVSHYHNVSVSATSGWKTETANDDGLLVNLPFHRSRSRVIGIRLQNLIRM